MSTQNNIIDRIGNMTEEEEANNLVCVKDDAEIPINNNSEVSGDELDQESLDWLARRRLVRENTRNSGTASSTSKGLHSLMRNITTPEGRRRKPEVIVVEDNMASTKTNMLKR